MTRTWRLGLSVGTVVIAVLVLRSPWFTFQTIKWSESIQKGSGHDAAARLRTSPAGVRLALADITHGVGRKRGWSSWIVLTTPLGNEAVRGLQRIVEDPSEPSWRRFEAYRLLWARTHDPIWLKGVAHFVLHGENEFQAHDARTELLKALATIEGRDTQTNEQLEAIIGLLMQQPHPRGHAHTRTATGATLTAAHLAYAIQCIEQAQEAEQPGVGGTPGSGRNK